MKSIRSFSERFAPIAAGIVLSAAGLFLAQPPDLRAQSAKPVWSDAEKPIADQISRLRSLPDDVRASTTETLALRVRELPAGLNKLRLANDLASLSTEGDFGYHALQEVATTLAGALHENPLHTKSGEPPQPYLELAELERYEHVQVFLDDPAYAAATSKVAGDDASRQNADFTLTDLDGKAWTLQQLRGNVVLVNFWATWCPPCRKEMPDLSALYDRFKDQGFVILGISAEDADKVKPFIGEHPVSYPILLDPKGQVHKQFRIYGIPMSFVYDRSGKLVAESIDMRTQRQFLQMVSQAGIQ
jgi:peroxiredoxin